MLGLARAVGLPNADRDYQREFRGFAVRADALGAFDRYNNVQQYYAYGLRATRSYSIWLLDEDPALGHARPGGLDRRRLPGGLLARTAHGFIAR